MGPSNVKASVPKNLMRHLVRWVIEEKTFSASLTILEEICATPSSPELVPSQGEEIQGAETEIGRYDLHDFFCISSAGSAFPLAR
jgi:NAD+ synthase (glutamine-hydrolysing)